jgi:hypothetical protein
MCAAAAWLFENLANWRWPEIFTAAGTVALAVFACRALAAWKGQEKAKRETDFLSELVDAVHLFIAEMSKPITVAKFIKIGMDSHAPEGELEGREVIGAIAYIRKRGAEDSKRLLSALEAIQPTTIRIQSLIAKGQVFKFDGYSKCYDAVRILAWHFGRLEALAALIAYGELNWDNPEVVAQLRKVMDVAADDLEKKLLEQNVVVLTFFIETYERIYGKRPEAARVALSNSHWTPQQSAPP